MWIVVLLALGVVVALWQVILAGLILWALVGCIRWWIALAAAGPKPARTRQPVPARPFARPVQSRPEPRPRKPGSRSPVPVKQKPQPVRDLPAPDDLPRWTASRRLETSREHAQWQSRSTAQRSRPRNAVTPPGQRAAPSGARCQAAAP